MKGILKNCLRVLLVALVFNTPVLAAESGSLGYALNNTWVLLAAALVFFMQAGFAMVEAGFTRSKNAGNIVMKNLMDFSVGVLAFWIIGSRIMFGVVEDGLVSKDTFFIFQAVFAATAATIVSGAMAERTKYSSYILFSTIITALIYPVVGKWVWGGGWLSQLGFIDFAGSTVVHSVGGWAALAGAMVLGPRIGRFTSGKSTEIRGHNLVLAALGVFILWFGWFGFNGGSTLTPDDSLVGLVLINTNLAAGAGAVAAMFFSWFRKGKADVGLTLNGALAGLVGITAGAYAVTAGASIIIGVVGSFAMLIALDLLEHFKVDDPVGAIGVHGMAGAIGTICVGLFALDGGLFYGGGWYLLGIQTLGVLATFGWAFFTSLLVFVAIKALFGLRVSRQEEEEGLDWHEHGAIAYPENGLEVVNGLFNSEDFHLSEAVRLKLQTLSPNTARSLREIAQTILATQESTGEKS